MPGDRFSALAARVPAVPEVQVFEFQRGHAFDKEAAREEMREYVEGNFTRLIGFAFYDSESENDFARPSVDLQEELSAEFGTLFRNPVPQRFAVAPGETLDFGHPTRRPGGMRNGG